MPRSPHRLALIASLWLLGFAAAHAQPRSVLPAPKPKETLEAYCARLERLAETVRFRCAWEIDWLDPGRPSTSRRIEFASTDFARVFEIARGLHGIPTSLRIPAQGPMEQTVADPRKPAHVWTSELSIRRSGAGQVEQVDYTSRQEGGGSSVRVQRKEGGLIVIEAGAFGD